MARSPIFLFAVIIVIAVTFVAVAAQMQSKSPTGGIYSNSSTAENQTAQFIQGQMDIAPNWVLPAMFLGGAFLIISVVMLFKRR